MMKFRLWFFAFSALSLFGASPRVLVYTRNYTPDGKGYVHDNIAASISAIRKMGAERGFTVDPTDDPTCFTAANLKRYKVVVFSNSNNEAFSTGEQREAFKKFVEHGGGFVGLHSASGSEREWPYFWSVVGGKFETHPKMQTFTVQVTDSNSSITHGVPQTFQWTDECYFNSHLASDIHPLLVTDRTKLTGLDKLKVKPDVFPNPLPLCWTQQFDGGREFYLALGHRKEEYSDPILYGLISRGILWAMGSK